MPSRENKSTKFWSHFLLFALFLQISAWSFDAYFNSSSLNSVIFLLLDQSDSFSVVFDQISAVFLLLSFVLFLITRIASFLLVPVLYAIAMPVCTMLLHSSFAYEYALLTHASRIGLPLILYLFYRGEKVWSFDKRFLIRLMVGLTFIGHGIEALMEHPKFIDFLIEGFSMLFGYDLSEGAAIQLLTLIGATDIVLAISGLLKPRVWIYSWMAAWGFVTAVCRVMYFEWEGVFPMLVRSAHWALPAIAVWAILEKRKVSHPWKVWKTVKG